MLIEVKEIYSHLSTMSDKTSMESDKFVESSVTSEHEVSSGRAKSVSNSGSVDLSLVQRQVANNPYIRTSVEFWGCFLLRRLLTHFAQVQV